jgi:CRISPR-associated protein Csm1
MGDTAIDRNSVVLAALLHDIGKFLRRGDGVYTGSHEEASAKFVSYHKSHLRNDPLYDIDLVEVLVKLHHTSKEKSAKDAYFSNKSPTIFQKTWKLLSVVKRADSYSCVERDIQQPSRKDHGSNRAPLDSIFSVITLDGKGSKPSTPYRYHVAKLMPTTAFPAVMRELDANEIPTLIKDFEAHIPDLSSIPKTFDDTINLCLNLLEEYTWAVPSDTRYEESDVSLYDHLRSSAAIAACLYDRHVTAIQQLKKIPKPDEFIFIGTDFSRIQEYIFNITNRGSGGASKRLRARSFFISMFTEVTIHKILHALQLPLVCNIFSSGGKSLLLAPNVERVTGTLQRVKAEINQQIHDNFFDQFSFLLSWRVVKGFRETFSAKGFFDASEDMFHRLESEKTRKAQTVLLDPTSTQWNPASFMASKLYESYEGTVDCKICGRGPAILRDSDEGVKDCCSICHRDKYGIGEELPKARYVAFAKSSLAPGDAPGRIVIFDPVDEGGQERQVYYVELLRQSKMNEAYYLVQKIEGGQDDPKSSKTVPYLKRFYANHVPTDPNQTIFTFEEIAKFSRWNKNNTENGAELLGILKVDVDNLGLIFSKGFEKPRRIEAEFSNVQRRTISRFLTMSRMMDLFFSGWLKHVMSDNLADRVEDELGDLENERKEDLQNYLKGGPARFENIYTVYSAGDDMVLVGPWETMIIFSIFLNEQFKKFTCDNEAIKLSAGLTFVKPNYPIASAIRQADLLLEESKRKGKDRITLFGTTVEWKQLPQLIDCFVFLNEKVGDDNSEINNSFLQRMLRYQRMAASYLDSNNIEGLKFLSQLSYDIGRNIIKRDRDGGIVKGQEELLFLQKLFNKIPTKDDLIYSLKVPLFWVIYRNRRAVHSEYLRNI